MSKELEALERIIGCSTIESHTPNWQKDYKTIETALKALEIIKEKKVDTGWLVISENHSIYNLGVGRSQALKKKEYDLIKEVLL